MGRLPTSTASVVVLIQPIVAAYLGWLLFAEAIGPLQADPDLPDLVYGPPAPPQDARSDVFAIVLAEPDTSGKLGKALILQEADLAPELRDQWSDIEAMRRALAPSETP